MTMTQETPTITVQGTITWLYHSSPTFSAGILTTEDRQQIRFRGKFLVQANERVRLTGVPVTHRVYGEQLDVQQLAYDLALDAAGLAAYLANNPSFRGIGPARATAIAQTFGADFDRIIREEPARLRALNLSEETIATLQREWLARAEINTLASWLSAYGLTHCQLTKIVDRYGHQAKALLTADPYLLCREVDGFGFARTDAVALKLGTPKDHPGRIDAAVRDQVLQQAEDGHCWVPRAELVRETTRLLALDDLDAQLRVAARVDALVAAGVLCEERAEDQTRLALPWVYQRERDLRAWLLAHRGEEVILGESRKRLSSHISIYGEQVTRGQRKAITTALTSRISAILGAAGSGKSYTVAVITDVAQALGQTVALCAPTGKAAKRLEEVTGARATTLHRLLGYNGREWARHHEDPLDQDIIIVDECSMLDIELAWRLFDALDFSRTRLILVGDHQQLPPVGVGNLVRDLLRYDYAPVCVLDQVIRQAGLLKENSTSILQGVVAPTAPGAPGIARPWYVIDSLREVDTVRAYLGELLATKLPSLGFDIVRDVQLVTPYRKGPLGTQALNLEIQRLVQQERHGRELPLVADQQRPTFYPGDKVMQTRNNYTLDLMNGAIGIVEGTSVVANEQGTQRVLLVDFDGRTIPIPLGSDQERELELAYATTVHKAQGSEFPCVIAIVHRTHAYMLHRNLLYTAVTRARQTAILFGDQTGLRRAAQTVTVDARRTWLSVWGTARGAADAEPALEEEQINA